jgi:predicted enzyme related to lactoylglutathione lyase
VGASIDFGARGREICEFGRNADHARWRTEWVPPAYAIGEPEACWTHVTQTSVEHFEAELGFLVDVLGLDVFVLQQPTEAAPEATRMAMLAPRASEEDGTPPFIIGIRAAGDDAPAAPAGSTAFEFMTKDLPAAWARITDAGAPVVREPWNEHGMARATARTPNGFEVRLWSIEPAT